MTTWRLVTLLWLLVFLSTVDQSEEGCVDYLNMEKWKDNVTHTIPLIETRGPKSSLLDMLKCTLARAAVHGRSTDNFSFILLDCLHTTEVPKEINKKCAEKTSKNISVFHLICLTARHRETYLPGCELETTCQLYSSSASTAAPPTTTTTTTTTLPPTTTVQETTTAAPTTTLPPTTSVQETTTAAPTTTTTTTTVQETTTAAPTTITDHITVSGLPGINVPHASDGSSNPSTGEQNQVVLILAAFLMISVILNVVAVPAWYRQRCKQRRQDRAKFCKPDGGDDSDGAGNSQEAEPMKKEEGLQTHPSLASVDRN